MAVSLDANQARIVETKRKAPGARPLFYNAGLKQKTAISEDFEAFLILQGRPKNKKTLDWLKTANGLAIADSDRDALLGQAFTHERRDAARGLGEVSVYTESFAEFREGFRLEGFQGVPEIGLLVADLQRAMAEIQAIGAREFGRTVAAGLLRAVVLEGLNPELAKQVNSWYSPLGAY